MQPVPLLLALASCLPAEVQFECPNGEPLCDTVAITRDDRPAARGIDIEEVFLYQGVEVPLSEGGAPIAAPEVSVVGGRDAMVRILVSPNDDWEERELTARLYLYDEGELYAAAQADHTPTGDSEVEDLGSTFNISVDGLAMEPGLELEVHLVEATRKKGSGDVGRASWPEDGGYALPVHPSPGPVRLLLVPVQYDSDGSGRLPDISEEQVQIYRDHMLDYYPATEVEIEVADPFPSSIRVQPGGQGWTELLMEVTNARDALGVDDDVYLYGAFAPADSFDQFCMGGCVAGISNMPGSAQDAYGRASIGLGYSGPSSAETMVHEVGHAHGRAHSPCGGAAGADPNYPHPNAIIGVRGYGLIDNQLKEPEEYYDFMSYCWPGWTSDYTWEGLLGRIEAVNDLKTARVRRLQWSTLWVHSDGRLEWGVDRTVAGWPSGERTEVEILDERGEVVEVVDGWFSPLADIEGGVISLPPIEAGSVRVAGVRSPKR